jgi:hypothetical protein
MRVSPLPVSTGAPASRLTRPLVQPRSAARDNGAAPAASALRGSAARVCLISSGGKWGGAAGSFQSARLLLRPSSLTAGAVGLGQLVFQRLAVAVRQVDPRRLGLPGTWRRQRVAACSTKLLLLASLRTSAGKQAGAVPALGAHVHQQEHACGRQGCAPRPRTGAGTASLLLLSTASRVSVPMPCRARADSTAPRSSSRVSMLGKYSASRAGAPLVAAG